MGLASLASHPSDKRQSRGTLVNHPCDKDLSPGTPAKPARRTIEAAKIGLQPASRVCVEVSPLELDWSQIVRCCMEGDSGAWAELVRTHHRRVYGLCYRFTGNAADAEDLTQDVFLKIYLEPGQLRYRPRQPAGMDHHYDPQPAGR